ncbi:hypothetical protein [uncultured Nostoc sp.]|uniref:hypothetical protein n=1 Tax=uncultured Nostoc sp. TaxID=340711 RepID=UPI0035CC22D7
MKVPTDRFWKIAIATLVIAPPHNCQTLLKSLYSIHQLPGLAKDLGNANLQKSINAVIGFFQIL